MNRFTAELYEGHSDRAVVVPFDPGEVWGTTPRRIGYGKHKGHAVQGTVNGEPFEDWIWFYFRERDYARTTAMFEAAKKMAQGAAMMTDTQLDSVNIIGSAWSGHFNKTIAEATFANINKVGLPVSIPEAQAAGVGVCWQEMPRRREEQLEFLGGAGFVVKSMAEVPAILAQPYPEEMRLRGIEI